MPSDLDPLGAELRALFEAADFTGARVLELGSGNGRLAFRYAHACSFIVGIESQAQEASAAVWGCPDHLRARLRIVRASGVSLPFRHGMFDIAVFAWSL